MKTIIITVFLSLVSMQTVLACRCRLISIDQIYSQYTNIAVVSTYSHGDQLYAVIERAYKGSKMHNDFSIILNNTVPGGECGYSFQENKMYFIAFNDQNIENNKISVSKCSGSRAITAIETDTFIANFETYIAKKQAHKLPKKMYEGYEKDKTTVDDTKILYKNADGTDYVIATREALSAFINILKNSNVIGLSKKSLLQLFGAKKPNIENNKLVYHFEFGKGAGTYEFTLKNNIVVGYRTIPCG